MQKNIQILLALVFLSPFLKGQNILTKEKAISIALKNNYNIILADNSVDIAKNNKSILNGGYLPSVSSNIGANYRNSDNTSEFQNGTTNTNRNIKSESYNASVGIGYLGVNIYNLIYSLNSLQETYELSQLQAKQVMENTLLTLFYAYYEVARLTENKINQSKNLEISKQRLKRVEYSFKYGQSTKLEVLNAEVDVNNDQISYLNIKRLLANAKRDLNVVLGRDVNIPIKVDTEVSYKFGLSIEKLLQKSLENNTSLLQANKNIELSKYNLKIAKSGWMPSVSLTSSYAWDRVINDVNFQINFRENNGFNFALGLSWTLFDGGRSINNARNAKLEISSKKILKEQILTILKRDVNNAWETYQNALFTMDAQKINVKTNKRNFKRSTELYKLAQITSIDFRQAQLNLVNAELSLSQAKYNAKNAELELLQLSGDLLENQNF